MKRGSCPDFSQEFGLAEESKESWISAFNRVNRSTKNCSNTVSGAERASKPDLESIFGGRSETYIDNTFNTVSCDKAIMCNGHNILSLTRESIMNMSLSDAHETLFQLRVEGNIMKKGFKRLKLWKLRFFILSGKILTYWEVNNHNKMRHQAEITGECQISLESIPNRPYAFSVLPSKIDRLYILDAQTKQDRDMWIHCIQVSKFLVQRINSRPTLRGIGSVYDHFSLDEVIGTGRYGVVRLAECNSNMKKYAVKIINKKKVNRDLLKHELLVVRAIKQRVYNENVVAIHEIYEDEYLIHIVMEYLGGGDLYDRINKNGAFTEFEAARVIRHITRALIALHEQNIYHLDVKPENIIYVSKDPHSDMKLADFGCSMVIDHADETKNEILGTIGYVAPEVLLNCDYSEKCDVYSLGILSYCLLVGHPPFEGTDPRVTIDQTLNGHFDFTTSEWQSVSPKAIELVKQMITKNPHNRISLTDVMKNSWLINPPKSLKRSSLSKSIQSLQMSFPSTLPGSKLYNIATEEWHTPRYESDMDSVPSVNENLENKKKYSLVDGSNTQEIKIPSFESFGPIPSSVPTNMNIV